MSANAQNYSIQVKEISVSSNTLITIGPSAGIQGIAFQWLSGITLCWYGGSSLAAGGTYGMVIPVAAAGSVPDTINFQGYRGSVSFIGSTVTASVIRVLQFYSAG